MSDIKGRIIIWNFWFESTIFNFIYHSREFDSKSKYSGKQQSIRIYFQAHALRSLPVHLRLFFTTSPRPRPAKLFNSMTIYLNKCLRRVQAASAVVHFGNNNATKNVLFSKATFLKCRPSVLMRWTVRGASHYHFALLYPSFICISLSSIIRCPVSFWFVAFAISLLWPFQMTLVQLFWKLCGSLNGYQISDEKKGWHKMKLDSLYFSLIQLFCLRAVFSEWPIIWILDRS